MAGGVYARVVAVAVAAGAAVLGFPAPSGAATAIVRPASRSRRPSVRHPRGHRIRRARQLRRARNCLPGQSGADVRVPIAKDDISLTGLMPDGARSDAARWAQLLSAPAGRSCRGQTGRPPRHRPARYAGRFRGRRTPEPVDLTASSSRTRGVLGGWLLSQLMQGAGMARVRSSPGRAPAWPLGFRAETAPRFRRNVPGTGRA
jgi:hypothetical protein